MRKKLQHWEKASFPALLHEKLKIITLVLRWLFSRAAAGCLCVFSAQLPSQLPQCFMYSRQKFFPEFNSIKAQTRNLIYRHGKLIKIQFHAIFHSPLRWIPTLSFNENRHHHNNHVILIIYTNTKRKIYISHDDKSVQWAKVVCFLLCITSLRIAVILLAISIVSAVSLHILYLCRCCQTGEASNCLATVAQK